MKPLLMHCTLGILLAYVNCHIYIWFLVVFTFVGGLTSGSNLLVYGQQLVVAGYFITAQMINNDGCEQR